MTTTRLLTLCLAFLALTACGGGETTEAPADAPAADAAPAPLPAKVQEAVTVAKAIRAKPDDTAAALADNGTTAAAFDALMYEIAADPALSKAFEDAMK